MKRAGLLAVLPLFVVGVTAATQVEAAAPHFALSKSTPEAGAQVASVDEVRLWFTEEPQEGTTSIRLIGPDGEPVHTGDVTQDPGEASVFSVATHGTLAAGSYTVAWRALGADGHVVRGDFSFTVTAE